MNDSNHYDEHDPKIKKAKTRMNAFKKKYFVLDENDIFQKRKPGLLKVNIYYKISM